MHDVRGNDTHLHEISLERDRTRFLQSGPWDHAILCSIHEQVTQLADDYAVTFCREIGKTITQGGNAVNVPNPKSELLVRFALQTIWRFAASRQGRGLSALGPYANLISDYIFGGAAQALPVILARNHLCLPDGKETTLVIAPFPIRLGVWRFWLFNVGGVQFYIKLDKRPLPTEWEVYYANGADPVQLLRLDRIPSFDVPILKPLMKKMIGRSN